MWSQFLSKYTSVPLGDQHQADIEAIYYFWMAVGAFSNNFRFKDQLDYKSCLLDEEPLPTDQPLVTSGDSPSSYRLIKEYSAGPFTQVQYVQRPVGSTITIANETGVEQDGSKWSLDEATGLLTPLGGFSGVPTTWGGEFDRWVRFDAQLNPTFSNFKILNVTVQLAEQRQALA